jgi:transcription antitermination factor NusG
MSKRWYVVHAYSGFEKSVMRAIQERITRLGMEEKFGQILVPVEEVVEMKGWSEGHFRAQILSWLCLGRNGYGR